MAADKGGASNPLDSLINKFKPDTMSGRAMKYPYTFTAKIAHFPMRYYIQNNWLLKYYFIGVLVSIPIFSKIQSLACSPENVAKWSKKDH